MTGAVGTIKFFFSEAFLGQHFEAVELEDNEPELGDLFLFRLMSPTGHLVGATLVYCGHGEIIHFEVRGQALLLEQGCPSSHQWVGLIGMKTATPSSWCRSPKEVAWAPRAWAQGHGILGDGVWVGTWGWSHRTKLSSDRT